MTENALLTDLSRRIIPLILRANVIMARCEQLTAESRSDFQRVTVLLREASELINRAEKREYRSYSAQFFSQPLQVQGRRS